MSLKFQILRSMVFVIVLSFVLALFPIAYGDIKMAFLLSVGTFVLSVVVAGVLMFAFRRG